MKREKRASILTNVAQLVQFDSIEAVNALLSFEPGDWVLVNSYYDRRLNARKPVYTVGELKGDIDNGGSRTGHTKA